MFGFTDNFDDYRNITDLDVLKDMYMKMKNAYREKQPKKEMPKGAPKQRVSGKKTQEDTMSLQHKRGSNLENYRIMKKRLSHLPSTDTFRDNATKMILPLASRKVRKKVTANMTAKYGGTRRKGTKRKGTRRKGKRSSKGMRRKGIRSKTKRKRL